MKPILLSLSLLTLTLACNEGQPHSHGQSSASKGNDEFRKRMAQGAGVFRPEQLKTSATLGLAGSEIAAAKVDEHSGAWTWAGFDTAQGEIISADADLLKVAIDLMAKYEKELGFSPNEILTQDGGLQSPYPQTRMITLKRQFQGTQVKGAFINVFFAVQADGSLRLSEIVNNSYGAINLPAQAPALLADGEALLVSGVDELKVDGKRAVIAPALINGRYAFSYATEFALKDTESGEEIMLTVDNATKAIHEAYSNHIFEINEIQAETYKTSYVLKDLITRPLEYLQIFDGDEEKTTDQAGTVDLSGDQVKVVLHNTHNNSTVYKASDPRTPISFNVKVGEDGKTLIKFGQGQSSGLNVYASVTETINFAAKYLSENELKLIRNGFDSVVDINDSCNAFYNGKLNFYSQSQRCANTGLISDVVKHEWGHGLDDYLGPTSRAHSDRQSGITDSAYSEGIGDILAAYVSRSPNMGQGFFLNDAKPLRNLKNNRTYPPANQNEAESHSLGLVVGGAFWDLHENLTGIYGSDRGNDVAARLFFRHLITSDRYLDAYQAVLRVDDNDNNPMTRSPNYCSITRAFARHNISGGEKVAEDCLDSDESITVKIDDDKGEGRLSLVLSASGASRIVGCPGDVGSCASSAEGYTSFEAGEGDDVLTAKGARKFHQAKAVVDVKSHPVYTFFSVNEQNVIMAKRTLEFKASSASTPDDEDDE